MRDASRRSKGPPDHPRVAGTPPRALRLIAVLLAVACGVSALANPRVLADRVDVERGAFAVVPVRNDAGTTGNVSVRFGNGGIAAGRLLVVVRDPVAGCDGPWLPTVGRVRVIDPASVAGSTDLRATDVEWAIRFVVPESGVGDSITIGGREVPASAWDDPPGRVSLPRPATSSDLGAPRVVSALAHLRLDPHTAWRSELISGTLLDPALEQAVAPVDERPESAFVADWANQERAVWRAALDRLATLDSALAARAVRVLAGVIEIFGERVTVWPDSAAPPTELRDLALDPALSEDLRVAAVQAWLDRVPDAIAWTVDDVVSVGPSGGVGARIGITNLASRRQPAWVAPHDGRAPALTPVLPGRTALITAELPPATGPRLLVTARVTMGGWTGTVTATGAALPLSPPGLLVGPLRPETSMERFLSPSADAGQVVPIAGVLTRRPSPTQPDRADHAWVLELDVPAALADSATDSVTVWFGRRGRSTGRIRFERASDTDAIVAVGGTPDATARRAGPVWSIRLAVPADAVDRDGLLRIGVELRDDCERRFTWPRPALPWQAEPSRAVIDLDAWFGFR